MKSHYIFNFIAIAMLSFYTAKGQVGINTTTPNSTLTVDGSFEAAYREYSSASTNITDTDHYISYRGTTTSTLTLPLIETGEESFTGRMYKINNLSNNQITLQAATGNMLRTNTTDSQSIIIRPGGFVEVVSNLNGTGPTWDISFTANNSTSNVQIYGNQVKIPPHNITDFSNHSVTTYDTPASGTEQAWWVISKTSIPHVVGSQTSRMTLVYEYQGTPFNNVQNIYPLLTAGNNSGNPDVFVSSFVSILNNGTNGRTRLTVTVARVDYYATNWTGTFLLNFLLMFR